MPKGVPKHRPADPRDELVPIGATHFPRAFDGEKLLPPGVSVRSSRAVQIEFSLDGRRYTESLAGAPTVRAVLKAQEYREGVLSAISLGKFDYATYFPESRKTRSAKADAARKLAEEQTIKAAQAAQKAQRDSVTMSHLFAHFVERFSKDKPGSKNALLTHREVIKSRLESEFGKLRPIEVTPDIIIDFRFRLRTVSQLSESRISNVMTPLRAAILLAVEMGRKRAVIPS